MFKPLTLAVIAAFILLSKTSFAQDELKIAEDKDSKKDTKVFTVKSLDGKDVKVRVIPDYVNHAIKIIYLQDIISVDDWGAAPDITILNNQFMKLEYPIRSGSNEGRTDMLIVCVNNGKLYDAMHIVESTNFEFGNEHGMYTVTTIIGGNSKKNYQLTINLHNDSYSKDNPEGNFVYNTQSVLHFDTTRNAFYSIKTGFWDTYTIHPNKGKTFRKHVRGNFPVIFLGNHTYYLINGKWYEIEFASAFDEF